MRNNTTTAGKTAEVINTFTDTVCYTVQVAPKNRQGYAEFLKRSPFEPTKWLKTAWATQAKLFDNVLQAKAVAKRYREETQMESKDYPRILRVRLVAVVEADKGKA